MKKDSTAAPTPAPAPDPNEAVYQSAVFQTFKDKDSDSTTRYLIHEYIPSMVFRDGKKQPGFRVERQRPNRPATTIFIPAKEFLDSHQPV